MRTIRVSVTAIDSWQYWKDHESSSFSDLLAQLRGETQQTEAMRKGSAFHKALETATEGKAEYLEADGYRFFVEPHIDLTLPALRELKLEQVFSVTSGTSIELVGKVDAIYGNTVEDHKTTGKSGSELADWMESQMGGFQWRHYLNMANADTFKWNCFVLSDTFAQPIDAGGMIVYSVKDFQPFSQHRYPGIEQDCTEKMREFVSSLGLEGMSYPGDYCTLANLLKANQRSN